ncbi:MAG: ATP synthase F1 subunit epsilon [Cyanobacteria bacterium P01_G01_bin.54]
MLQEYVLSVVVRVIAPDKTVWDAPAAEVRLPALAGPLYILTDHDPTLAELGIGVMCVRAESEKEWVAIAIMGGFVEVEDNEVTLLVNGAEKGDSIDSETALRDFQEAEIRLNRAENNLQERIQATQAFDRARARYEAAQGNCS